MNEEIKARLLAAFRVEAEEHLAAITANLVALDSGLPPADARGRVEVAFREMHTLKGAARSVGLADVEALSQACEAVLSRATRGQVEMGRPVLNRLQDAVDGVARILSGAGAPGVRDLIARLERAAGEAAGGDPPASAPAPTAAAPATAVLPALTPAETIRLDTAKLNALLLQAEDLLVRKLAAEERVHEARALVGALASDGAGADLPLAMRAAEGQARDLLAHLTVDHRATARAVDDLHDELRRIRLTPASAVLEVFPRMVRDLARAGGKEVEWVVRGADLQVDRQVLDAIKEPLIHVVRNALDHGIEAPEARARAGKARRGRLAVSIAALEGGRLDLRVEDDGCGIEPGRVRAAAVRARVLSAEAAEALADDHALDLIFRSGLSTSSIITDLSGHGLGLAIVKERVEHLGGQIRIETRPGAGTTVCMILPASITTFRGLLVGAGGQRFLLPIDGVVRAISVGSGQVGGAPGREVIRWNGQVLSLVRLDRLLALPAPAAPPPARRGEPCVIVRSGEDQIALLVDEVLGDREVRAKELGFPLARVRNIAGAGLLGTGLIVLILRPADLVKSIRTIPGLPAPSPARAEPGRATILVVDDSITTRTMEKSLLETAGYQVRVAADGREAWMLLRSEEFDLVVSDVDMPGMDGFELTTRIRADPSRANLPVVLVTALDSREDKERGIEVGANAYVIKSNFDQSNLLEIIRRLI